MYAPQQFREERREVLIEAIATIRFAALVLVAADGLEAAHIPMIAKNLDGQVTLEGHVARGNPIWRAAAPASKALAIFQGPQAYVHPGWLATKKTTGKVVPTWNYVAVHAHGAISIIDDASWLRHHVEDLTTHTERAYAEPWAVSDAPVDYIAALVKAIIGIRIEVARLEGAWKMIQHHPQENRLGVISGLAKSSAPNDQAMAATMIERERFRRK
jgi:transcriptional regulator